MSVLASEGVPICLVFRAYMRCHSFQTDEHLCQSLADQLFIELTLPCSIKLIAARPAKLGKDGQGQKGLPRW